MCMRVLSLHSLATAHITDMLLCVLHVRPTRPTCTPPADLCTVCGCTIADISLPCVSYDTRARCFMAFENSTDSCWYCCVETLTCTLSMGVASATACFVCARLVATKPLAFFCTDCVEQCCATYPGLYLQRLTQSHPFTHSSCPLNTIYI